MCCALRVIAALLYMPVDIQIFDRHLRWSWERRHFQRFSHDFSLHSSQSSPIFTWLGHLTGEDEKWSIGVAASKEKNGNYDKSRDASMGWFFGWGKHLSTAREGGKEK